MKKLLSALLAVVLLFGMSSNAFAAASKSTSTRITGYNGTVDKKNISNAGKDLGDILPKNCKKDIALAYLTPDDFTWSGTAKSTLTMSDLSSGKVKLRYRVKEGKQAVSAVRLASDKNKTIDTGKTANPGYNKPAILLTLNSIFPSLKEVDFEIDIYVYVQGQGSQTEHGFTVTGTLANPVEEVEKGDEYLDMRYGHIASFNATCKNFEFELTDEISIWGTGVNKKKYWAYADTEPTEKDEALMSKYPNLNECITLKTLGFAPELFTVKFHDLEPATQYVYTVDSKGQLLALGKSNASMPVLSKYYLSTKEISGVKKYTAPTTSASTKG